MSEVYFLHQIKHNATTGAWDKGIVVKDSTDGGNYSAAKQAYHAYLGAYAYGHDQNTDYVACYITSQNGSRMMWEVWDDLPKDESEPEPEGE